MFKIEKKRAFGYTTIKDIHKTFSEIDFSPSYQRYGDIWPIEKKQLLIDSIVNNYDLPKFYFHYIVNHNDEINSSGQTYAIIDGKQRLIAIKDFIENKLKLSDDFIYEKDTEIALAGLSYNQIASLYPEIKSDFDLFELDIVYVITDELEKIEELFYRLNEGKPLNNAEKRNRITGDLNNRIREIIAGNIFFRNKFIYTNKRLQYSDTCLKLIITEYHGHLVSFDQKYLDEFVIENREETHRLRETFEHLLLNLEKLNQIFIDNDPLLKSRSIIPVYYYFISHYNTSITQTRPFLQRFNEIRIENRSKKETNPILNEFDRQNQQGTHREYSLKYREAVLEKYYEKYIDGEISWDTRVSIEEIENNRNRE